MRGFLLLFLIFPLLELFLLIRVGSSVGASTTLLWVLASGVLGVLCIRLAGFTTALKVRQRMAQGEVPNSDMLNGLLMVVGGGLLFLPGFISDTIGVLCLLPFVRQWLIQRIGKHMHQSATHSQQFYSQNSTDTEPDKQSKSRQAQIIEGEYERKDP